MKKALLLALILVVGGASTAYSQVDPVEDLIISGIHLHDQGKYEEALAFYDQALELDPDNYTAKYEKAYSYHMMGEFKKTEKLCNEIIENCQDDGTLMGAYTTLANSLDNRGKVQEAIKIYDKGISKFPSSHLLHFNKAIALSGLYEYEEAIISLQESARINPFHASSFLYMGFLEIELGHDIKSILALSKFMMLEPDSERSVNALALLMDQTVNMGNVEQTGDDAFTIYVNYKDDEKKKYSFSDIRMALQMTSSIMMLDLSEEEGAEDVDLGPKNDLDKFRMTESMLFEMLGNDKKKKGYYWEDLAPFFNELFEEGFLEAFIYDAHIQGEYSQEAIDWIDNNNELYTDYVSWINEYKYPKPE